VKSTDCSVVAPATVNAPPTRPLPETLNEAACGVLPALLWM
jgi:hypothetical protein